MTGAGTLDARPSSPTEVRSERSRSIDRLPTRAVLEMINGADATVPGLVRSTFPVLEQVVDAGVAAIRRGGRVHYFGAGSSGRFGVLDAAEIPPTFGVGSELVIAHLAGGERAMLGAVEDAEDSRSTGADEASSSVRAGDLVIGIAASGRTPYVLGALAAAREIGAVTAAVTSNPDGELGRLVDHHVCVETGPEVVTGSTRMKAGTAQKLVLHSFSTALMVRLGRTYSNLMVDVVPTNAKLRARVLDILCLAAEIDRPAAERMLDAAGGDTKTALVALLADVDVDEARRALVRGSSSVRSAVDVIRAPREVEGGAGAVVGVDVGASGFRFVTRSGDGELVERRGRARPVIGSEGLEVGAVVAELAAMLADAGIIVETVGIAIAGAGLLGIHIDAIVAEVQAATGARRVVAVSDAVGAHVAALDFAPGVVLAAGTGAIAIGSDLDAVWRRVDGLGHLLGDRGSGAWIGRCALESVCRPDADVSSALVSRMRSRFGSEDELVRAVYRSAERAAVLASFVPEVIAAAAEGDAVADGILDAAADELAATARAAAEGIPGPIVLTGGLMSEGSPLVARVSSRLAATSHPVRIAEQSTAVGVLRLAEAWTADRLPGILRRQVLAVTTSSDGALLP